MSPLSKCTEVYFVFKTCVSNFSGAGWGKGRSQKMMTTSEGTKVDPDKIQMCSYTVIYMDGQ